MELSSQGSLMPLHSAIAAARLISSLTIESQRWGLVPQGMFCLSIFLHLVLANADDSSLLYLLEACCEGSLPNIRLFVHTSWIFFPSK